MSTFVHFGSISSGPELNSRVADVPTELGGGEAQERVEDIEPQ